MTKIEVIPYNRSYQGLCCGNPEIKVVRAKRVTTKGCICDSDHSNLINMGK